MNMKLKELNKNLPIAELCQLGRKYRTDKAPHGYTKVYYEVMKDFRNDNVDIFEIGIYFGASLKMWEEFFPNGKIYGIDNGRIVPGSKVLVGGRDGTHVNILSADDVKLLQPEAIIEHVKYNWVENERIRCFTADQRSQKHLQKAFEYFGTDMFDVILDDGQHFQEHQQKSVGILFPNIKSGRYYIIEDVVDGETLKAGTGIFWGQRKKDASDSTDFIFTNYIKTGKLESPYISKEQCDYIVDNTEDIFMYDCSNKNNSPINSSSKLLIIKKK
jgi:hypothetical protein